MSKSTKKAAAVAAIRPTSLSKPKPVPKGKAKK